MPKQLEWFRAIIPWQYGNILHKLGAVYKENRFLKLSREASTKHDYLRTNGTGNLNGFQANFDTFFHKYLSRSDTCQLERKKKRMFPFERTTLVWQLSITAIILMKHLAIRTESILISNNDWSLKICLSLILNVRESKVLVNSIACFEAVIVCLLVSCNGSYLSSTEKLKSNETPFLARHGGI